MDFKFKVVEFKHRERYFTIGRVYEAKNGVVFSDDGFEYKCWSECGATFENLQEWFREYYIFELVTDDHVNESEGILTDVITNDYVNHPSHYNKGKIEVADFISDQKLNFERGNAVKYVCRAGSKDPEKEIQDLEKAVWYINHEIKMLKGETDNGTEKET